MSPVCVVSLCTHPPGANWSAWRLTADAMRGIFLRHLCVRRRKQPFFFFLLHLFRPLGDSKRKRVTIATPIFSVQYTGTPLFSLIRRERSRRDIPFPLIIFLSTTTTTKEGTFFFDIFSSAALGEQRKGNFFGFVCLSGIFRNRIFLIS